MTTFSSHVLDAARGGPAVGVHLELRDAAGSVVATARTDGDGRFRLDGEIAGGPHDLVIAAGDYLAAVGTPTFLTRVVLGFEVDPAQDHYHVALLLSPFACTAYRGS